MNSYGLDYLNNGRNAAAVEAINSEDSDEDGYTNAAEIAANRFPGDANDDPSKVVAPYRIYTKAQLEAMPAHTQFMLMNASRQTDDYAEYTGVPMEELLQDAGILEGATGIKVYAPDGWSNYHPLEPDPEPELYHVNGVYTPEERVYYYHVEADLALNPEDGWCDYSAPSAQGRNPGDPIEDELKMLLAYKRDGVYLQPGILNEDNKLDGEGPYRVVPPQKNPGPPDQADDTSKNQDVVWPYDEDADHNKGAASRSATIIKVEPLPEATTDIDILEAGWSYVDQAKIIVYGAIDGSDSNGNGVLDSEEGTDPNSDFDGDSIPDYQDTDTAQVRHANGVDKVLIYTSSGAFANVVALGDEDPAVPQEGKPSSSFPYGTIKCNITGLNPGEEVTVTVVFPDDVPQGAKIYKIDDTNGWHEIPYERTDNDDEITVTLTDGDPLTDGDGEEDGNITDPTALAVEEGTKKSSSGGSSCFIDTILHSLCFWR
jgi:hypothetical protein